MTRALSLRPTAPPSAAEDAYQPEPECPVCHSAYCDGTEPHVFHVDPDECACCGEAGGLHSAACAYSGDDGLDHDEGQAALNSRAYLGERGCL